MNATGTYGNCKMRRTHGRPAFADFVYLAPFSVDVSAPAMSRENQGKSNQIKPNPTKSNHYFFSGEGWHFGKGFKNSCGKLWLARRNLRFL